jgi:hypothetical protein
VPAVAAQAAQAIDPHLRDARTILDAVKARVPVISESVPVRRNVWGEPIERGNSVGPDLLSPIYAKQVSADPVRREIGRLRVLLSMPQRFLRIEGQRVDLTPEQYDELVQLSGQPAKKYLDQEVRSPAWRQMRDDERAEFVKETMEEFRAAGRDALKARYPELGEGLAPDDAPAPPPGFGTSRATKAVQLKPKSLKEIVPPEMIAAPPPPPPGYIPAAAVSGVRVGPRATSL